MKKNKKPKAHRDEEEATLVALCNKMDSCFAYIGHYQTGHISHISPSVNDILGYSQDYFVREGVDALRSVVHPDDMPGIVLILSEFTKDCLANVLAGTPDKSAKVTNYYFRAKHNDGRWMPVEQRVFILSQTESGLPDLIFSILSTSPAYIDEALTSEGPDGEREKLLSYLEATRLRSKQAIKGAAPPVQKEASGVLEITTHLNPVRNISEREKEILKLIGDGFATKEIAGRLCISFHTVESHRKNLLEKFGVKNSAELIKAASKFYWIE